LIFGPYGSKKFHLNEPKFCSRIVWNVGLIGIKETLKKPPPPKLGAMTLFEEIMPLENPLPEPPPPKRINPKISGISMDKIIAFFLKSVIMIIIDIRKFLKHVYRITAESHYFFLKNGLDRI